MTVCEFGEPSAARAARSDSRYTCQVPCFLSNHKFFHCSTGPSLSVIRPHALCTARLARLFTARSRPRTFDTGFGHRERKTAVSARTIPPMESPIRKTALVVVPISPHTVVATALDLHPDPTQHVPGAQLLARSAPATQKTSPRSHRTPINVSPPLSTAGPWQQPTLHTHTRARAPRRPCGSMARASPGTSGRART